MKGPLFVLLVLAALEVGVLAEEKPITVAVGQDFAITLESKQSPDYQWVLASPLDERFLKHCGREYKRANPRIAGASGREVITFRAMAEGKTAIRLKYGRLRQETPGSAPTTNLVVVIKKELPKPAN